MTRYEYSQTRDTFVAALKGLRHVEEAFFAVPFSYETQTLHDALDEYGFWISSEELSQLEDAMALLERLVGRAAERAAA